jgi:hypothetical protein
VAERALTHIRTTAVDDLLANWEGNLRAEPDRPLVLDLAELSQLERVAGLTLSCALLGSLGDAALILKLPPEPHLDWLLASGLAFAVANRSGRTALESESSSPPDLRVWKKAWTPGTVAAWKGTQVDAADPRAKATGTLFAPSSVGEPETVPDLYGPTFAAFVDPHLTRAETHDHPLSTVVWPWLDRLLPRRPPTWHTKELRRRFIGDVGELLSEVVLNIAEHAAGRGASRLRSLVQVSVTRGGRGSFDRLYLSVQDIGPGIAATARPKVDPTLRATLADHQLVFKLVDGSLPPWGRARGMGLPRVLSICQRHNGSLHVATKTTRLRGGQDANRLVSGPASFCLDGTLVALMLPLPPH